MTEVAFHSGLPDTLAFACRLVRKAYRRGSRVLVAGPRPLLERLDRALWTFDEQDFVPHLQVAPGEEGSARAQRTPVWLAEPDALSGALPPVLLNLSGHLPAEPARFERVIEPVGLDAAERQAARARWRAYEALGLALTHHQPAAAGGDAP